MRFQILSLSGGGYLGLYAAKLLVDLEKAAGRPLGQCFDLICGTSIGGILALGLGAEISAAEMMQAFEEHGTEIFSNRPRPTSSLGRSLDLMRSVFTPKYSDQGLRRVLSGLLTDRRLSASRHRLLIPSMNMTRGHVQMFKTAHVPGFVIDHSRHMVDLALATSAAPTYFPLAEVGNALFADGGLAANAPDLCGLHEAVCFLDQAAIDIHLLSLGTTTSTVSVAHAGGRQFGAWRWMQGGRLFSTILSAQQQLTHQLMRQQLGDRYLRLDADLSLDQEAALALDVATPAARKTLKGLAEATYQAHAGDSPLRAFLAHRAPTPTFYHT